MSMPDNFAITEDAIECQCGWRGYEASEGVKRGGPEDDECFLCPLCGGVTAYFPICEQAAWIAGEASDGE